MTAYTSNGQSAPPPRAGGSGAPGSRTGRAGGHRGVERRHGDPPERNQIGAILSTPVPKAAWSQRRLAEARPRLHAPGTGAIVDAKAINRPARRGGGSRRRAKTGRLRWRWRRLRLLFTVAPRAADGSDLIQKARGVPITRIGGSRQPAILIETDGVSQRSSPGHPFMIARIVRFPRSGVARASLHTQDTRSEPPRPMRSRLSGLLPLLGFPRFWG